MRGTKRLLTALSLLAILAAPRLYAEGGGFYGLSFHSYEVSPDDRTSLVIPADTARGIRFSKYLGLKFDIRIDTSRECFGYICRVIVDERYPVDIFLSNPSRGLPYIGVTTASGELKSLGIETRQVLSRWHTVTLSLSADDNRLDIDVNGVKTSLEAGPCRNHSAVILFGRNTHGRFISSDVAPMVLRDLSVSLHPDGEPDWQWQLLSDKNTARKGSGDAIDIKVENPDWTAERHSRWRKIKEFSFGSKVFPVLDNRRARILLAAADRVVAFTPADGTARVYPYAEDMRFDLITNDFTVLPDGTLLYCDFESETPAVSAFDFEQQRWEHPVARTTHSKYLHHTTFFNEADSSVVQLFGYGFHRYLNECVTWQSGAATLRRFEVGEIPPRYLSAAGVADTTVYIFGGKGNPSGMQELGTTLYKDLYRISLNDYSVAKLWERSDFGNEVAASNLVVDARDTSFTALFYSPNDYKSQLQMRRVSIADGTQTPLGNAIPYNFIDVESDASLLYDAEAQVFYAVVAGRADEGAGHSVSIYAIHAPVAGCSPAADGERSHNRWWMWIIPLLLASAAAAAALLGGRYARTSRSGRAGLFGNAAAGSDDDNKTGIRMVGGFRITDASGEDITANFTPIMRQLLVLLILNSDRHSHKGISNTELKESLWADKSEESYYNNRGVNLRKIRLWLEKTGNLIIVSEGGYWSVAGDTSLCDYLRHYPLLHSLDPQTAEADDIEALLAVARCGTLLPDMQFEWLDRFKAEYSDRMITLLTRILESRQSVLTPQMRINLADAVLTFDSLDETAIRTKCSALIELKRYSVARNVFAVFTREYERLMGETYSREFNTFIKAGESEE